eukprot:CAMPEP_0202361724 /NCGR_PEP_ID=MMETSP1126-20121109/14170_1 /ASSEMBLY_ACC=CAM_ASM_000457 /TAXON_ID=3047 /ORGANISM="Dunaliella tertiolecta, Strain CCMP1320" /LENGTH=281 /DNA_ID=CAMNT_0048955729 /DNA_START=77 /DNA_END=919 /DNA_ORIENTATION=+
MRIVCLAACQHSCSPDKQANVDRAESCVRDAAASGAHIICIQELFEHLYVGQETNADLYAWSAPAQNHPQLLRFAKLAVELEVVLAVPFFERANNLCFNSVAVVDADGSMLGGYRKSHIPSGPGYEEKFYFAPGDTGFKVFKSRYGCIGVAICWDQWFPEVARALVLQGAEVILYPTAIGTEPHDPTIDSYPHWCRVQQGHAAANMVPVVASNRVGKETFSKSSITFYGGSFVCGPDGAIVSQVGASKIQHGNPDPCPKQAEGFCLGKFDLDDCARKRLAW